MEQIQTTSSLDGIHQREKYIQLTNGIPQTTITKKILDCRRDNKQLFSVVNSITNNRQINPLPDHKLHKELADDFADFFIGKIQSIGDELSSAEGFKPQVNNTTFEAIVTPHNGRSPKRNHANEKQIL